MELEESELESPDFDKTDDITMSRQGLGEQDELDEE
jgi:hypothetical protein